MNNEKTNTKKETFKTHRFLDEAGDPTFYGKGRIPILGTTGVSKCFILGMLQVNEPLQKVRNKIIKLQNEIAADLYYDVPSIRKKKEKAHGYFAHAKDDIPEVREKIFKFIKSIDCNFEAVVGRKYYSLFEKKHNGKDVEFYADLLSHLLQDKLHDHAELILNISDRGSCTAHTNLENGKNKAVERSSKENICRVVYNVQKSSNEPLLNIADYFCWAIQRVFEKGEARFYNFLSEKITMIMDVYDEKNGENRKKIYSPKRKLKESNMLK